MTETLRDMMAARADAAPGPNVDIQGVVRNGQRRVWRHRVAVGTAACAAVAAVALVVPGITSGDGSPSDSAGLGEIRVSYASGSTIHYGDETIDVSPHKVTAYVQTDDGFVYTAKNRDVYLVETDGGGTEQIGHLGGIGNLVADDSGSYVGWLEIDHSRTEVVVFDTASKTEVLRTSGGDQSDRGCLIDADVRLSAIDGDTAYICGGYGDSAWSLVTEQSRWTRPPRADELSLTDGADGYLSWSTWGETDIGAVVSDDPDAAEPRYEGLTEAELSPGADYIVGYNTSSDSGGTRVVDRESGQEVSLDMPDYREWYVTQWLDDERFAAAGYTEDYDGDNPSAGPDLLACDASSATCTVVGELKLRDLIFPTGGSYWS